MIVVAFICTQAFAESLNEKVARNASNCLVGHIATKSDKFQSGKTSEYIFLIEQILGSEKASEAIKESEKKLNSAVRMLGSSKKEEGSFLIKQFCPAVDEIVSMQAKA